MKEKKVGVHTCIRNTSFYLPGRSRRFSFPPSTTFPPFNRFTSFVQLPNKRQTPIRMYDVVFFFFFMPLVPSLYTYKFKKKIIFFLCGISYAPVPSSGDDISTAARGRQCTVVKFQTPERKLLVRGGACRRAIQSKKKKK